MVSFIAHFFDQQLVLHSKSQNEASHRSVSASGAPLPFSLPFFHLQQFPGCKGRAGWQPHAREPVLPWLGKVGKRQKDLELFKLMENEWKLDFSIRKIVFKTHGPIIPLVTTKDLAKVSPSPLQKIQLDLYCRYPATNHSFGWSVCIYGKHMKYTLPIQGLLVMC